MSLVVDAMQPTIVRGLLSISGRLERGAIADIILPENRIGYDLDLNGDVLCFDFRDKNVLALSAAKDICRFANASFTTYKSLPSAIEDGTRLAWSLIQAYYSAFYAGHALIRITGQSCSNFEGIHIAHLRKIIAALGLIASGPLETGMYHLVFNQGQTGFICKKASGRSGGAHEVFWKIFGEYISALSEDALLGHLAPTEARDASLKLDELSSLLKRNGSNSYNWLSNVRNQIQYQHSHGVWPSVSINKTKRASLSRVCLERYKEPMEIDLDARGRDDLTNFVFACGFIVSLCEAMIKRIQNRSDDRMKSFAKNPLLYR
ncbi:hypothetical protein E8E01_19020 [Methylorubrum populi]|uniref:hypothetical protein n=1 Tax=Methylorubrum populi TaxID=223967 RepID=UPI0011506F76|nr:hypothetical protein [Methylorubrum populi]QDI82364.1 hypothetical protein E8E01_19020 [Methylorubrum populi]